MLKIKNLCKSYPSFKLKDVSFVIESGYITGFIGMNGAGKTTTLKSILNIVKPDSGDIRAFGKVVSEHEKEVKQQIGFMLGGADYYLKSKVIKVSSVFRLFYEQWDEEAYRNFIRRFNIDENKTISELSSGMRVKLALTYALSHRAKLLIFDELTSGLDPIARDELLDLFHEIIEDGEKSILFSTHITSDLDKCADYILFIRDGEIIANSTKDDLVDSHLLVSGKKDDLTPDIVKRLVAYKEHPYGFKGLMLRENKKKTDTLLAEKPNLEEIMIYYNKGAAR